MNKIILPIIIIIAVIAGITIFSKSDSNESMMTEEHNDDSMMMDDSMEKSDDNMMMEDDHMESDDDKMMEDDAMMMDEKTAMESTPGSVVAYEDTDISTLSGNIVLYFYASWCPTCRTLTADIDESLADVPSDLTIVVVNYDKSTDLKKQYGVTSQHTLVQVDSTGNQITKWSGGNTLESIISQIQ